MHQLSWKNVQAKKLATNPTCRWGHSSCVVKDQLYVFGGFANSNYLNDLWSYNLNTLQWSQIITFGDIPEKRSNATLNYDSVNHQLLLFGGGGTNKQRFNTISMLDLQSKCWVEILPFENQSAPWQRTYHIAEFKFPYLIVFGGEGVDDLGDLWIYNFTSLTWRQVKMASSKLQPKARRFHSSCLVDNKLYIFGGCYDKYYCLSDFHSLDLTDLLLTDNYDQLEWQQIKIKQLVAARWGHTSYHYNGQIYVFGGRAAEDLNDLIAIDIHTGNLRNIEVENAPKARRRHSGGFMGSCLILYGGFDGNYYDDLFYINVFKSKHAKSIQVEPKVIKQPIYQLSFILDKYGQCFNINMALISLYFDSETSMKRFLQNIKGEYSRQQLRIIFQTLYKGYGDLPLYSHHFKDISRSPMLEKIKNINLISEIIGDCTIEFPYFISKENFVVELDGKSISKYLRHLKEHWSSNNKIFINNNENILSNKERIIQRSLYFLHIFQFNQNTKFEPVFNINYYDFFYFQLILAYLQTGLFVIPKNSSLQLLSGIVKIAEYLSLNQLLRICQKELSKKLNQQNYSSIHLISKEYRLEYLDEQCNMFLLKELQYKNKKLVLSSDQLKKLNKEALELYRQIVFDVAHLSQRKPQIKCSELKQAEMNKENEPSNGLKNSAFPKKSLFN